MAHLRGRSGGSGAVRRSLPSAAAGLGGLSAAFGVRPGPAPAGPPHPGPLTRRFPASSCPASPLRTSPAPAEVARQPSPRGRGQGGTSRDGGGGGSRRGAQGARDSATPSQKAASPGRGWRRRPPALRARGAEPRRCGGHDGKDSDKEIGRAHV